MKTEPARSTPPIDVGAAAAGTNAGHDDAVPRPHDALLLALAAALLARCALSFADAWSLSSGGFRFLPIGDGATVGGSPFWSFLWGVLSLASAALLVGRHALGWVLAVAACVAFLVSAIGDVTLFQVGGAVSIGAWVLFVVDLAAPAVVLALLISVRPWFLAVARRPQLRLGQAPASTRRPG